MAQTPPANGAVRWRPVLPIPVVVVSILVAVGAVTGLILLLYQETRGPGEVLRQFARAVDERDCGDSYGLLDDSVHASITEDEWCRRLPAVDERIDADFDLDQAVLEGDRAIVHIEDEASSVWVLNRFGERSWRVVGPEGAPLA